MNAPRLDRALALAALAFLAACGSSVGNVQPASHGGTVDQGGSPSQTIPAAPIPGDHGILVPVPPPGNGNTVTDPNLPPVTIDPNVPVAVGPCGDVTAAGTCDGGAALHCVNNVLERTDCAATAQACVADANGAATCAVPNVILTSPATFDINGNVATVDVYGSYMAGAALTYRVKVRESGKPYRIACTPVGSGRTCAALEGWAIDATDAAHTYLTVGFSPGIGLALAGRNGAPMGGAWGPTVLRQADLDQVKDAAAFVLLDTDTLGRLPIPADAAQVATYQSVLGGDAAVTWDTVRFRLELTAVPEGPRDALAALITSKLTNDFVMEHMAITHQRGWLQPGGSVGGTTYALGGFTNGHRTYIRELEAMVRAESPTTPFRRLPAFDPAIDVPADFMLNLTNPHIALSVPSTYQMSNPDGLRQFVNDDAFGLSLNNWHNQVHNAGGGAFAVVMTASSAPLFFCWHTSVDVLWDGYRLVTQLR